MVESSSCFGGVWAIIMPNKRQFRLQIFVKKGNPRKVSVSNKRVVVTRYATDKFLIWKSIARTFRAWLGMRIGLCPIKGACLAKVTAPGQEFIASSIHMNDAGAKEKHDTLERATAASKKGLKDQSYAWEDIRKAVEKMGGPAVISGDLNPRTVKIPKSMKKESQSDRVKALHDGLNGEWEDVDGATRQLIFRRKFANQISDGVLDDGALYTLDTLQSDLKSEAQTFRKFMLLGDSLRYHQYKLNVEQNVGWEEGPIAFMPTYKMEREKYVKTHIPAFTDRHILWKMDSPSEIYLDTYRAGNVKFQENNPSDHNFVSLDVTFGTRRRRVLERCWENWTQAA